MLNLTSLSLSLSLSMMCAICIPPMTLSEVLNTCVLHSLSRAWQLGRAVYRAKKSQCNVIEAIVTQQQGLILLTGKVSMKRLVSNVIYILLLLLFAWSCFPLLYRKILFIIYYIQTHTHTHTVKIKLLF